MIRSKSFTLVKDKFRYVNLSWLKFLIIPGLAAFILLLILTNVKPADYYKKENHSNKHSSFRLAARPLLHCTKNIFCVVTCVQGDIESLQAYLRERDYQRPCKKVELHLLNIHFPEDRMTKGWIDGDFKVTALQIRRANIREIAPDSFESPVFEQTTSVELAFLQLIHLSKESLNGLYALKKLVVLGLNEKYHIEENFLEGLQLEELAVQIASDKKVIKTKSLLGSIETPSIKRVDLTGNMLGKLSGNSTFDTLTGVEVLNLADCHITEIAPGTFDTLPKTLQLIDLRRNSIKIISPEVFKRLIPAPGRKIMLCNNPLSCSKDMCPFVDFYLDNKQSFESNLKCFDVGKETNFEDHVLCKHSILKDIPYSPPTHVTELPIVPLEDKRKIHCDKNIQNDFLEVAPPDVEFFVETVSSSGVKITVVKTDGEYSLLWFHSASKKPEAMETNYNDFGLGCNTKVMENVIIEGMKSNSTYVFCLIKVGSTRISPFNCHSHYLEDVNVDEIDPDQGFLIWGSKPWTISLICVGVLFSFIIGGCCAYYIVSWKPTLVKGSKRVVVINKSSPSVLVLPRNSNSSAATTESNQRFLLRRNSDGSITSSRSYVMPLNMYEAVQYHQRKWRSAEGIYADKIPKDCPPPLPKRLSEDSTIPAEEVYGDPSEQNNGYQPYSRNNELSEVDLK